MGGPRGWTAAGLALLLAGTAHADKALYVDNADGSFLRPSAVGTLSAEGHTVATAALVSQQPPFHVDSKLSAEVDRLLTPDALARPEALLSVQLVGVPDDVLAAMRLPFATVSAAVSGGSTAVAAAMSGLKGAQLRLCEATCDAACTEAALGPLPAALPADSPAVHRFAAELVCFSRRVAELGQQDAGLVTARISGFKDVALQHGADAAAAAGALLSDTLAAALRRFHDLHGGSAAAQIVSLATEPLAPLPRRELAKAGPERSRDIAAWNAKVASFSAFILVFVAGAGGIICLCSMPTGTDTLLFQRTKQD